jgi:hypothetical protein
MNTEYPRITIYAGADWRVKAISIASQFLREGIAKYGSRYSIRDGLLVVIQNPDVGTGPTFVVWGDEKHVRVRQIS